MGYTRVHYGRCPHLTWYSRHPRLTRLTSIGVCVCVCLTDDGQVLTLRNISRHCSDMYECIADNGVPPSVSRRMRISVECQSIISAYKASNLHFIELTHCTVSLKQSKYVLYGASLFSEMPDMYGIISTRTRVRKSSQQVSQVSDASCVVIMTSGGRCAQTT